MWENDNSVVNGFQLATISGPMCEEPMMGVCFIVEDWQREVDSVREKAVKSEETDPMSKNESSSDTVEREATETEQDDNSDGKRPTGDIYGPLSGQLISAVKEGCRRAFMSQPMRLMAAMYSCEIQATSDVLGKVYAVLGKREGRVLSEDMKEGTDIFNITSVLPVAESFGFCEEIRKKTSGLASPQLVFSHWEVVLKIVDKMYPACNCTFSGNYFTYKHHQISVACSPSCLFSKFDVICSQTFINFVFMLFSFIYFLFILYLFCSSLLLLVLINFCFVSTDILESPLF